ncbi:MAG: SUMF1/EgtB/PvdO family nonheme iron enzyme [Chloroflexia bacterium]|nr:SUMF1/EgtB/PvdO family nonheme iron enzyme [Chloroflexia bacterium]
MLRGGSWNNNERNLRSANRNNNDPDNTNNNIGFRCVVVGAPPRAFLEGQVRRVHGGGASAPREDSRPVPGWVSGGNATKDEPAPPGVVGLARRLEARRSGRSPCIRLAIKRKQWCFAR